MAATRRHYIVLSAVLLLLGALGVMAYRSNLRSSATSVVGDRQEQLAQIVENLEVKKEELQERLADLRRDVASLGKEAAARKGLYEGYTQELDRMSMQGGLVPVEGPGITVTLADNHQPPEDVGDPNDYIIHDYDVRVIVNALWAAGAEAIAINEQRLAQLSSIRCVGTTVLVNNTRVGSPFVIEAIGDSAALAQSLKTDAEARALLEDSVRNFGLEVSIKKRKNLELPAYAGSIATRELRPGRITAD